MPYTHFILTVLIVCLFLPTIVVAEESDPAEVLIGERLFLETRFAQSYFAHPGKADPILKTTRTASQPLRGPFAGQTINCRNCHLVDEHAANPAAGMRSYADFASLSPIPSRQDEKNATTRNSMSMVNISLKRKHGPLFHYDGEFNSLEDLVRGTLSGRNFGWLASEKQQSITHVASVIRRDDGKGELASEFGGRYAKILTGTADDIPKKFRLPPEYRVDVAHASDQAIVDAVAKLIAVYVRKLEFNRDEQGLYAGSPYDAFLIRNKLPRSPMVNESDTAYSQRLLQAVNSLNKPSFIDGSGQKFKSHTQDFIFGEKELVGMKLFFSKATDQSSGGNCISCHTAPHFSDFSFHNTGLTQQNYDRLHGHGAFIKLAIPSLVERSRAYEKYLPATASHPDATGRFRAALNKSKPGQVDLGLWNVFANPDMPAPQNKIRALLCDQLHQAGKTDCHDDELLSLSLASFKTPVLRDLGHSGPYMHTGQFNRLKDIIAFYVSTSVRYQQLRNPDPALQHIRLKAEDIESLIAFLQALNEDYE